MLTNGDLLIRDLAFSDMGMFKCIVRNDFGEDMKETFVYPHSVSSHCPHCSEERSNMN